MKVTGLSLYGFRPHEVTRGRDSNRGPYDLVSYLYERISIFIYSCRVNLCSALLPGQAVKPPATQGGTVVAVVEFTLEALGNVVDVFKPIIHQQLACL